MSQNMLGNTGAGALRALVNDFRAKLLASLRNPGTAYKVNPESAARYLRGEDPWPENAEESQAGMKKPSANLQLKDAFADWVSKMPEFYKKFLGIEVDPTKWNIPAERREGFNWLIYEPEGLSTRHAVDKLLKPQLPTWEETPVEEYCDAEPCETPKLVLCRDGMEPDKEWRDHSGDMLRESGKLFLTQRQYVILAALVWYVKKKHLDVKGWTRFPESRAPQGGVAYGHWYSTCSKVGLLWSFADVRFPYAVGREAVSLL